MQRKEFRSPFLSFEAELSMFLLSSRSMGLLDQVVAARGGDDLDVLRGVELGNPTQRRTIAPQLVGVNGLWNAIFTEQADEKGPGRLSIAMFLKEDVQYGPIFVNRAPQPVPYPTDLDANLVEMPPRTPTGFSVTQFFGKDQRKLDVPLPHGLVADLNATLVEQLLHITLAGRASVGEPQGVPDDTQEKPVTVRLAVSHSWPVSRASVARTLREPTSHALTHF